MSQTIIVVDDEPALRNIIAAELKDLGFQTLVASDGADAFEIACREKVDLVITDVRMPTLSGIELLDKLMQAYTPPPPVFLLTAFADISLEEALHRGASGILGKPVDFDQLEESIRQALKPIQDKWKTPVDDNRIHLGLKREFDSREQDGRFRIGRGGFFITEPESIQIGELLHFEISFVGEDLPLCGQGIVRWNRNPSSQGVGVNVGVDFYFLDESSRETHCRWVLETNPIPYIPMH